MKNTARGTLANPGNRFDKIDYIPEGPVLDSGVPTTYFKDQSKAIITDNESPDVGFESTINPYRGCEHGCVYCYARPSHEYLNFSPGLDFETKIMVKEQAPVLLDKKLASKYWQPRVLGLSGVTDAYQPIEKKLELTRSCLKVLVKYRNPVTIVTKNRLVCRDSDLLQELAQFDASAVFISLGSLDETLARKLEPRASLPRQRLEAIKILAKAGVPVGVLLGPVVPGLTESEVPDLLKAAREAGASFAGYLLLRLPESVQTLFEDWLEQNYPTKKEKVLNRIRDVHGGTLHDSRFHLRMKGEGVFAEAIRALFYSSCKKFGLNKDVRELSTRHFRSHPHTQLSLF